MGKDIHDNSIILLSTYTSISLFLIMYHISNAKKNCDFATDKWYVSIQSRTNYTETSFWFPRTKQIWYMLCLRGVEISIKELMIGEYGIRLCSVLRFTDWHGFPGCTINSKLILTRNIVNIVYCKSWCNTYLQIILC